MLTIGEFSALTGLGVKALRHYDERGVIAPAAVDERSGYRQYSEAQVRDGVTVRALRDAGVSLADIASALTDGNAPTILAAHEHSVREARAREDAAFAAVHAALQAMQTPIPVEERTLAAQPYVGRVISVSVDDADQLTDEHANAQFEALFHEVEQAGLGPVGSFWTTMRAGEHGLIELVCCWPTAHLAPTGWGGEHTERGVLPARTELVATWNSTAGEPAADGYTHPAIVALYESLAARDLTLRTTEVRQTVVGADADDFHVEVSVTISEETSSTQRL